MSKKHYKLGANGEWLQTEMQFKSKPRKVDANLGLDYRIEREESLVKLGKVDDEYLKLLRSYEQDAL